MSNAVTKKEEDGDGAVSTTTVPQAAAIPPSAVPPQQPPQEAQQEASKEDYVIPSIAGVPIPLAQLEQEAASRERSNQSDNNKYTPAVSAPPPNNNNAFFHTPLPPPLPAAASHAFPPQSTLPALPPPPPPPPSSSITNAADPRMTCPMQLVKPFDATTNLTQKIQTYRSVSAQHDVLSKTLYPPIPKSEVTEKDVLFGRGGGTNRHRGNMYFRDLVSESQPRYLQARKLEKTAISKTIIAHIRSRKGRFLKWNPGTDLWEDVGDRKAVEKASQALREGLAGRMRSVTVVKDALAAKGGNVKGEPMVETNAPKATGSEAAMVAGNNGGGVSMLPPPLETGTLEEQSGKGANQIISIPTTNSTITNHPSMVATPLEGTLPSPSPPPKESTMKEENISQPMTSTTSEEEATEEPTEPDTKRPKMAAVTV